MLDTDARINVVGHSIILHCDVPLDDDSYEEDPLLRLWYPIQDRYWYKGKKKKGQKRVRKLHMVMTINRGLSKEQEPRTVITLLPNAVVCKQKKMDSELIEQVMREAQNKYVDSLTVFLRMRDKNG